MYRVRQIQIKKGQELYTYCAGLTVNVSKLYNRANYIIRQYATGTIAEAEGKVLHPNQTEILALVRSVTEGTKYQPKSPWMNYCQLDYLLKKTKDRDYYGIPSHVNQQTLRMLLRDYRSFFEGLKKYQRDPKAFTGRPHLPGYKKNPSTAVLTNEVAVLYEDRFLKLPKCSLRADIGPVKGKLKEVRIKPVNDRIVLEAVMESLSGIVPPMDEDIERFCAETDDPGRVLGIDPGLDNLLAITNNFGVQPLLISGRILKSINQYYNKELARLKSAAERCNRKKTTKRIRALTRKRGNRIRDAIHKISSWVRRYAKEHGVRVVVMGHNRYQKQEISLSKKTNQSFVQIPMDMLRNQLKYKLEEEGILFVCTEESYTSKSDYLAGDAIPLYRPNEKNSERYHFSGKRIHRGLYRHYDGSISNADINGAANILRKVFPNVPKELWNRGLLDSPYQAGVSY